MILEMGASLEEGSGARPRQRNLQEVLFALVEGRQLTQQQLAHETGLSRATVARIVSRLMERGLIESERSQETSSGAQTEIFSIRRRVGAALSINFGRSHIRVVLRDLEADSGGDGVVEKTGINVPERALESLDAAVQMAWQALDESPFSPSDLVGVCVGFPAPIDRSHGRIAVQSSMSAWVGMKPAEELRSRLLWDVPMLLENDADLGSVAELEWGAGRGHANMVYVKWGAGVGGGI